MDFESKSNRFRLAWADSSRPLELRRLIQIGKAASLNPRSRLHSVGTGGTASLVHDFAEHGVGHEHLLEQPTEHLEAIDARKGDQRRRVRDDGHCRVRSVGRSVSGKHHAGV